MSILKSKTRACDLPTRGMLVAGVIFGATLCFAAPASATEIREAVRLCDKNPACDYKMGGADGGMDFTVNGVVVVTCPPTGQCGMMRTSGPVKGGTLGILTAPKSTVMGTVATGQKPGIGKPIAPIGTKPIIASSPAVGKPGIGKPVASSNPKPMVSRAPKVEGFPKGGGFKNAGMPGGNNQNQGTNGRGSRGK